MGIMVFDKEKTWKMAGAPGGGGGGGAPAGGYGAPPAYGGGGGGYGGGGGGYAGGGGGGYSGGGGVGPSGHDYRRDDDGSVRVDVAKVDAILAQRMHAKMQRDFATADKLRVCAAPCAPSLRRAGQALLAVPASPLHPASEPPPLKPSA